MKFTLAIIFVILNTALSPFAFSEDGFGSFSAPGKSEEEDFSSSPYTEYGEFNEDDEEAATTQYMQYGRFFGASLGLGTHGAFGNRGNLWEGGFPTLDLKLHYWFDFNFALQLGFTTSPHTYTRSAERYDVRFNRIGIDLKYYFDTRDASAAITFAGPYLVGGVGSITKSETNTVSKTTDHDTAVALSLGAGLEFTLSPKKVYFFMQGTFDIANFKDTNTSEFQASNGLDDLTGQFYTLTAGMLFTW